MIRSGVNPTDYLFDQIGPDNCDHNGNTFLHYAAYLGDYGLCKVLLSEGWFVLQKNTRGETALDYGVAHPSVKELLDAAVKSLAPRVLDFALSNHSEELKRQNRERWRKQPDLSSEVTSNTSSRKEEVAKSTKGVPEKQEVQVSENKLVVGRILENHGSFSPTKVTSDHETMDWTLPEELTNDLNELEINPVIYDHHSSTDFHQNESNKVENIGKFIKMKAPIFDFTISALCGRISAISLIIEAYRSLLSDNHSSPFVAEFNIKKVLTDQDHADYGDSIAVMKRVFDDEVRILRVEMSSQWENLRATLRNELEELAKIVSDISSFNFRTQPPTRSVLSKEEEEDYDDAIDVMLRAFSEKLVITDSIMNKLKSGLIGDLNSMSVQVAELVDSIDLISFSTFGGIGSIVTEKDVEEYGSSIDVMRRLCHAELTSRLGALNKIFEIINM